jgi:hypothetical protein
MRTSEPQHASDTAVSMRSTGQNISETVVTAVAEYKRTDEVDLNPPLYEAVDPEALDTLFRESRGNVRLDLWNCTVDIGHDGVVTVSSGEATR